MIRDTRRPKPCQNCGKEMLVPKAKWERKRFCSRQCLGKENAGRLNERKPHVSTYAHKISETLKGRFVGDKNPWYAPPVEKACEYCGQAFQRKPWQTTGKSSNGLFSRFCSRACRDSFKREFESGPNAPDYVGGPATYRGREWLTIRSQVIAEQNGHCNECGVFVGLSMPVHHIKPFREFADTKAANTRNNLVGLCQPCHMKIESRVHPPFKKIASPAHPKAGS